MPTLIRLAIFCLVMAGLVYAAAFGVVWFLDPPANEVVHTVPRDRFAR